MAAERDATDRYIALYLAERVGTEFDGRITGVTRFGLFVRLQETGADGLVPISRLGDERFIHDEALHALIGQHSRDMYRLGRSVTVRLEEATPVTGGLLFEMLTPPEKGPRQSPRGRGKPRGRPQSTFKRQPRKKGRRR